MIGEHAIHNGVVIHTTEAVVPVTRREVQFGFSTYESIRIIQSHPVHLADHLVRLAHSCEGIKLVHPFGREELTKWVYDLIKTDELGEATMRIQIYGGPEPQLFITAQKMLRYPDSYYTRGVGAITYFGERLVPSCKTGNLLLNYLALEEAHRQDCFEALLADRNGRVLEGTRSNFFAFERSTLYTASDELVLLGITRERVLKAAAQLGFSVVFTAPLLSDLKAGRFDELFISATSMAAMPLARLDDRSYSGPYAKTLAIRDLVRSWELED
ncbi:MAG: aminotransferase class IV [Sphaerochaeta sp.]|jgi:branched-subunit amino acid aminotransferase/4-amino-4-deoxychorismate lyase|uniref:aminotransferase class IV n=1 Tax=Sphaerochaeta sp. TaxID=1972642 RepID=UPI002FC6F4C5